MSHELEDDDEDANGLPRLKPCPFCGEAARFGEVGEDVDHDDEIENEGGQFVACSNRQCGASTMLMFPLMESVKRELADLWNTRTPPAAVENGELATSDGLRVDAEPRLTRAEWEREQEAEYQHYVETHGHGPRFDPVKMDAIRKVGDEVRKSGGDWSKIARPTVDPGPVRFFARFLEGRTRPAGIAWLDKRPAPHWDEYVCVSAAQYGRLTSPANGSEPR